MITPKINVTGIVHVGTGTSINIYPQYTGLVSGGGGISSMSFYKSYGKFSGSNNYSFVFQTPYMPNSALFYNHAGFTSGSGYYGYRIVTQGNGVYSGISTGDALIKFLV